MINVNSQIIDRKNFSNEVMNTGPTEIEETILMSFGHSIIDFEDTLFEKFQHLTKGIVLSRSEFLDNLHNMEERGILASGMFLGKKCWGLGPRASDILD